MPSSLVTAEAGAPVAGRMRLLKWVGLMVLVCGLGIGLVVWRHGPAEAELPSELASNLVRREGRLYSPGASGPFDGWMLERYPDSGLKSRSRVVGGMLEGVSEGWFTNGVLQIREHFVDGTSEGPVTKWHANGVKLSEGTARAGKFEGMFRRWHENGQLAEELVLQAGQPDGVARSWFPSGSLKAEATLKSGQVLTQKFWKDGEQVAEPVLAEAGGSQ